MMNTGLQQVRPQIEELTLQQRLSFCLSHSLDWHVPLFFSSSIYYLPASSSVKSG